MTEALSDFEAYLTTYRRDYAVRTLEMTGPLPQSIPAPVKTQGAGLDSNKRPRRRGRRPAEASSLSQNGGGFILPGRSLTVGPAPGVPRPPSHGDERDHQVSEALKIDLPDGDNTDYNQWLLSKLPEIVEKCCRQQEPPPRVIEVLPPPVRRKIRINVTANPNRTSPGRRQDDHPEDPVEGSTDEFVLDGAELRQVHRARSPSRRRRRQRRRSERRGTSSSASSLESVRRTAAGDAATAELVRRVLEEMFGPRPATGGGGSEKQKENLSRNRNRSCQTSPRLASGMNERNNGCGEGQVLTKPAVQTEPPTATDAAAQTELSVLSPRRLPPPPAVVRSMSPSPRPRDTSRCILDTLTESNRLLRQMSEFFRRAELNDRITQRMELGDASSPRPELPSKRAGGEVRSPTRRYLGGDSWRYTDQAPTGGGGTTRSDGGLSHGDGVRPCTLRQCSDSELSARIRRFAAEQSSPGRGWERPRSPTPVTQLPLPSGGDSVPSSGRSWASPQLLELHSEDRPYRPLVSPPPRHADTPRSESGAEDGPRTSSPVAAAPPPVCSHRQAAEDIDSTDVLLSYDPWHAIENDFKTLLN
ncbi:serine/arginine repetitive matrix protein 1-like [Amphibalanus amphitrite]|uniref:serine/arginine repetitive matrix protein 1-like n=1 Tax=Amphibalanus amphitrite TaxID=1232801 RepID=UPI001C92752F|nr:serine/arginine repetitive matrix protein 1-like [Amphibalanus amphitrite]